METLSASPLKQLTLSTLISDRNQVSAYVDSIVSGVGNKIKIIDERTTYNDVYDIRKIGECVISGNSAVMAHGVITTSGGTARSQYLPIDPTKYFYEVTTEYKNNVHGYVLLSDNFQPLNSPNNTKLSAFLSAEFGTVSVPQTVRFKSVFDFADDLKNPALSSAKYVVFNYYSPVADDKKIGNIKITQFEKIKIENVTDSHNSLDSAIQTLLSSDYFYGKKYIAAGDSFTAPPYTSDPRAANPIPEEDYDKYFYFQNNTLKPKSYAWYIANRHNMDFLNIAQSGAMLNNPWIDDNGNPAEIGTPNADRTAFSPITVFTEQIKNLVIQNEISSADYMTIAFGLNEKTQISANTYKIKDDELCGRYSASDKTTLGVSSDSCLSTCWGAWNSCLSTILSINNDIKLGIIINDSWQSEDNGIRETTIKVAKAWGIPYIDMSNDDSVPLMLIGGYGKSAAEISQKYPYLNPYAIEARKAAFDDNLTDKYVGPSHPNIKCQQYRSTIIENFMRGL